MKDVGIEFVCPRTLARGKNVSTDDCPFGVYETFFPPPHVLRPSCFHEAPGPAGHALVTMLEAMHEVGGMRLHLGLAYPKDPWWHFSLEEYGNLQALVASSIWVSMKNMT